MNCIWCKAEANKSSVEHIIPEALGCPDGFVLHNGEVCVNCNAKLARLDRAVLDDFEILTFMLGILRKNGKNPTVANRGNIVGGYKEREKFIAINMERNSIKSPDGKIIGAFGKSKQNIKTSFARNGSSGMINFLT
jgi:hypothetical protein